MDLMSNVIAVTILLIVFFGWWNVYNAWTLGGEFYIKGNFGRRKKWIERLLDGFEVLRRM